MRNLHAETCSEISPDLCRIFTILATIWVPKYIPKTLRNRLWESVAPICHRFDALNAHLGALWLAWPRYFVDLGSAKTRLESMCCTRPWHVQSYCTNCCRKLLQAFTWGFMSPPVARRYVRSTPPPPKGARRARPKIQLSQKKYTTKGYTLPSTYGFNMGETLPHSAKL